MTGPGALPHCGQPTLLVIGIEVFGFFADVEQFGRPHRRGVEVEVGNAGDGLIERGGDGQPGAPRIERAGAARAVNREFRHGRQHYSPQSTTYDELVKRSSVAHFNCSIAQSLEIVGEWWTPLVLRNVFLGRHRFEAIQADLGIARNILSDRLSSLVAHGVLHKVRYCDHPERYEYHFTEMGEDLFGVLMALMAWGDRWLAPDGAPVDLVHAGGCGERTRAKVVCEHCGVEMSPADYRVAPGPGAGRAPTRADD